ncbi:MAG: hypothetical protein JWN34_4332 [Bryobacterales bacterium]|nr:hypothetical protein [Bryobacterales bacterium]
MTPRRKKWLIGGAAAAVLVVGGLYVAASMMANRVEPFIRDQAIKYLRSHFDGDVELAQLKVHFAPQLPLRILLKRPGTLAQVQGQNLQLRQFGHRDSPPLFSLKRFSFEVDVAALLRAGTTTVNRVTLDGMEIQIPPKGERPASSNDSQPASGDDANASNVVVNEVDIRNARLVILPKDKAKAPLQFDIRDLKLGNAGQNQAMTYTAVLNNPKPPGLVRSNGTFGPWSSREPSDTPLSGDYLFENADLGIFNGIAGILRSTGHFQGTLANLTARGEAFVPDFRLKRSGNPVPLKTEFEVLVDGTNGNTELKPVQATLGSTKFTTTGFVVKHDGDERRTIFIDANIPAGNLRDILRLAMPGNPMMEGTINLKAKIGIPPLATKVKQKMDMEGNFEITNGKFLRSAIQSKINMLSQKAQGNPDATAAEVDEAVHHMSGRFKMADEAITFRSFAFQIPGAAVNLDGTMNMAADSLDFHGALMLDARLSQTQSGWKRWVLKPVDPFFAKNGAGTYLRIKVTGSSKDPQFGLDH